MHIAVDLDDCVVQFWPRVVECYQREHGTTLEPSNDWGSNPIKNSPEFGDDKAYQTWWDWWRDRHWLWADCDAVPGAIGALAELRSRGHWVELVTHKPEWARRETTRWLAKWHPQYDALTFVPMGEPKHEHTDALLLVDDRPHNIVEWVNDGRPAVVFTQDWNEDRRKLPDDGSWWRADTWQDVLSLVWTEGQ